MKTILLFMILSVRKFRWVSPLSRCCLGHHLETWSDLAFPSASLHCRICHHFSGCIYSRVADSPNLTSLQDPKESCSILHPHSTEQCKMQEEPRTSQGRIHPTAWQLHQALRAPVLCCSLFRDTALRACSYCDAPKCLPSLNTLTLDHHLLSL